jgi:hypothetical protein
MKKFVVFCLLMSLLLAANAQPGYLGKKLSISYEFEATPFLFRSTNLPLSTKYSNTEDTNPFVTLAIGHHINLGYVLNRKSELIVNFGYRPIKYDYLEFNNSEYGYYSSISPDFLCKEYSLSLGLRHFFRNQISPIGSYHQITIGQSSVRVAEPDSEITVADADGDLHGLNTTDANLETIRISYGLGIKKIIASKIFISMEANLHFNLTPLESYKKVDNGTLQVSESEYSKTCLTYNFTYYSRYTLAFGLGIIL